MLNIGGSELLVILLVALIVLGPERLPHVARQGGQMVSTLRSLANSFQAEMKAAAKEATAETMRLEGPTDQATAIAATQADPFANKSTTTDTHQLAKKAREVDHSGEDKPTSDGGPSDLRSDGDDHQAAPKADQSDAKQADGPESDAEQGDAEQADAEQADTAESA